MWAVIMIVAGFMADQYHLHAIGDTVLDENGYQFFMFAGGTLIFWLLFIQILRALDKLWTTLGNGEPEPNFPQKQP